MLPNYPINQLILAPSGIFLMAADYNYTAYLIDMLTSNVTSFYSTGLGYLYTTAISPDSTMILVGGESAYGLFDTSFNVLQGMLT